MFYYHISCNSLLNANVNNSNSSSSTWPSWFSDVAQNLLEPMPTSIDLSKLEILEPQLISEIIKLSSIQPPNSIHRLTAGTASSESPSKQEKLIKLQKELDDEISKVRLCHFAFVKIPELSIKIRIKVYKYTSSIAELGSIPRCPLNRSTVQVFSWLICVVWKPNWTDCAFIFKGLRSFCAASNLLVKLCGGTQTILR